MRLGSLNCCGISELRELGHSSDDSGKLLTPADKLWDCCVNYNVRNPCFRPCGSVLFTQASGDSFYKHNKGYGFEFAEWLKGANLGEVIDTLPWRRNPNTGNHVKTWIWQIDMNLMEVWVRDQVIERNYREVTQPHATALDEADVAALGGMAAGQLINTLLADNPGVRYAQGALGAPIPEWITANIGPVCPPDPNAPIQDLARQHQEEILRRQAEQGRSFRTFVRRRGGF